jgi:hypothetical protein
MKKNRKNTNKLLINICYAYSINKFEEFYGFTVEYKELEQESYIEFKDILFENINPDIKFRKHDRIENDLIISAEMYPEEIDKFSNMVKENKIRTIYDWVVKKYEILN